MIAAAHIQGAVKIPGVIAHELALHVVSVHALHAQVNPSVPGLPAIVERVLDWRRLKNGEVGAPEKVSCQVS